MTNTNYLITYVNAAGEEEAKLATAESVSPEGEPTFEVEGISLFNILSIQPYL